jgi:hypothetical protein
MGELGFRGAFVCVVALLAACGSKQSAGSTTAHAAEAAEEEPPMVAVSESEPVALEPEEEAEQHELDEPEETAEERDLKMMSYEEAMAVPVELGDANVDGGEAQLSAATITGVMDGHLDAMYHSCIEKELRRGNPLGTVTMDLAIRGADGMVLGATIVPGRRRFKGCLEDYLEDIRFPTFAAPRMGTRYTFFTD